VIKKFLYTCKNNKCSKWNVIQKSMCAHTVQFQFNFLAKPVGKRPRGICRRKWEDNIKTDFKENGWEVLDWIHLAKDRDRWRTLVNIVMKLWVL
jgi:hypothetical protein